MQPTSQRLINKELKKEDRKTEEIVNELIKSNEEFENLLEKIYITDDHKDYSHYEVRLRQMVWAVLSKKQNQALFGTCMTYVYSLIDAKRQKLGKALYVNKELKKKMPGIRVLIPQGFLGIYEYKKDVSKIQFMATYGLGPCVALTFRTQTEDLHIGYWCILAIQISKK